MHTNIARAIAGGGMVVAATLSMSVPADAATTGRCQVAKYKTSTSTTTDVRSGACKTQSRIYRYYGGLRWYDGPTRKYSKVRSSLGVDAGHAYRLYVGGAYSTWFRF